MTAVVAPRRTRLPLNNLAVAFGLSGLAGMWTLAADVLGAPESVALLLWAVAVVAWVGLTVAHAVRGWQSDESLADQLRHPAQGPIAALMPVVGLLVGAEAHRWLPRLGPALVIVFAVVATVFAGWMLAHWVSGHLHLESVHGGYFLPTVAGGFVAGGSLAKVGLPGLGYCAFAVGLLFWLMIGTLILARIAVHSDLPAPLIPTLAIFVAPPAVGGSAWFALNGPRADVMALSLGGATVILTVMQFALAPRYRRLSFSLGFWSFTFPYAAVAHYSVEWLALERPVGWRVWAWMIVVAISSFITVVAVQTLRRWRRR
ncbi:transporter [Actinoplanes sp. Pm04-4]|uniref:Transporter n=1 Tax=Paractinoplanes pyxinae TaxID=2997416 RepID=A0ABT4AR39_9ACTN|nr:transporter [Actinoplanes pyxinae]MCY1136704.1 transporter [Actinoplanes pyxinae]